jgi:hypothetical protein
MLRSLFFRADPTHTHRRDVSLDCADYEGGDGNDLRLTVVP